MYIYIYIYIFIYVYIFKYTHILLPGRAHGRTGDVLERGRQPRGEIPSFYIYLSINISSLSLSLYIYTYSISIYLCIYIYLVESVVGQRLRWSSLERGGQPRGDVIREVGSMPGWRKWRLGALFTLSNLKTGMGLRDTLVSRMGGIRNIQ